MSEFLFFAEAAIKSNQKTVHCLRIKVDSIDALFQDEATGKTVIVCGDNWYWVKESLDQVSQQMGI